MFTLNTNNLAYRKALLHSLKFPNSYVAGVFVGTYQDNTYNLVDCYPITHHCLINPFLEISLSMIETS